MYIGNDIIDLTVRETPHPRFARRVMSDREYDYYCSMGKSERILWRHWAAKETVYKLEKQRRASIIFSPPNFEFDDLGSTVEFEGRSLSVRFEDRPEYIFCWCSEGAPIVENIIRASNEAVHSFVVREIAQRRLAEIFSLEVDLIEIGESEQRVPIARGPNGLIPCSMSFSHHGGYAAVSMGV